MPPDTPARRRLPAAAVVRATLALLLVACGGEDAPAEGDGAPGPAPATAPPAARPVVLVTLDTTRADHLSCYGYPVPTTPRLDGLAERGVLFERAYAPMGQTLPSHATLFTGRLPREHGLTENHAVLVDEVTTLAELFAGQGYATAGFTGSRVVSAESGIGQGFEHYDESQFDGTNFKHVERNAAAVSDAALAWLGGRDDGRPLFLWCHYFDPHLPFEAPDAVRDLLDVQAIAAHLEAQRGAAAADPGWPASGNMAHYWLDYDAELRFTDHHLGRLLDGLAAAGLEDAVIAVVGDHGEGLLQHGEKGHGVNLFEELMRVPALIVDPSGALAGTRVAEPVGIERLGAALLRLGLGEAAPVERATLWDELLRDGRPRPGPVFVERPHYTEKHLRQRSGKQDPERYVHGEMTGVIAGDLKLLVLPDGTRRLFDLASDPLELVDLSGARPEDTERLARLLDDWRAQHPFDPDAVGSGLSEERRQALSQLGYGH